ncbi:hypothetical protein ACWGCW_09230 [Streptomyces sp. NPDC054933]
MRTPVDPAGRPQESFVPSSDALQWDSDICSSGGPTDVAEIV